MPNIIPLGELAGRPAPGYGVADAILDAVGNVLTASPEVTLAEINWRYQQAESLAGTIQLDHASGMIKRWQRLPEGANAPA